VAASARPTRVGLIGYPLGHSLSPAFQQAALDAAGIAARYELWPTPPADLPAVVDRLRRADSLGCNVTVPHKEAVLGLVDALAPGAARLGAANTIVREADGRLRADNTDLIGFRRALGDAGLAIAAGPALLLGAGGAARAVLAALLDGGAPRVIVANRHPARAERLIADLGAGSVAEAASPGEVAGATWLAEVRLVINATSGGWHGDETPIDPAALPPTAAVYDLTYRATALLRAARARGLTAVDGLRMLVYQGAASFELWTGRPAPVAVMLAAAERALAAREADQ
jgi:shikimate dehydrogenase